LVPLVPKLAANFLPIEQGNASALSVPLLLAQQQGKVWRIGILVPRSRPAFLDSHFLGAFAPAMRELGYVEGRNLVIEWRFADGKYERLPALAVELVKLKVDVILGVGSAGVQAAQQTTASIPIVMASVIDPLNNGGLFGLRHCSRIVCARRQQLSPLIGVRES